MTGRRQRRSRTWISDEQAREFFDANAPGGWAYDPEVDVWVVPDADYDGPGVAFWVYQRDGRYFHTVEALQ